MGAKRCVGGSPFALFAGQTGKVTENFLKIFLRRVKYSFSYDSYMRNEPTHQKVDWLIHR